VAEKPDPEMSTLVPPLQAIPFRVATVPGVVVDVLTIETSDINGGGKLTVPSDQGENKPATTTLT
jgi:hypothetical protein